MTTNSIKNKKSMVKIVGLSTTLEVLHKNYQEKGFHGDVCVRREDVLPVFSCKILRNLVETKTVNDVTRIVNKIRKKQKKHLKLRCSDWQFLKAQKALKALIRLRRALDPIRELLMIYKVGQSSDKSRKALGRTWSNFIMTCIGYAWKDDLEVTLKHDFQVMLAKGCGKPVDSGFLLFKGHLKRIILLRAAAMNRGETKSASLLRSIYESKRHWEELSTKYWKKAMENHEALLTTPGHSTKEAIEWIYKAVDMIIPFGTRYEPGSCVPTFGASYQSTRADGGNHGYCSLGEEIPLHQLPQMDKFYLEQQAVAYVKSYLGREDPEDEKFITEFQAIPEPGKFRVITKGDSGNYTALRPLQKFLLKRWKGFVMNSMSADFEERLHDRMTNVKPAKGTQFEMIGDLYDHFVSGDYSNATDALHRDATEACIDRILFNLEYFDKKTFKGVLTAKEQEIMLKDLCQSIIKPEVLYALGSPTVKTCRGQLMGHPISFPLLCIINLSTFLRTFGYETRREVESHPSFINGDDILFKGDRIAYDEWRRNSGEVGLVVNEVKTYFHKKYYLINSILGKNGRTVEYLNTAVAHGVSISGEPIRSLMGAQQIWDLLRSYKHGAERLCAAYIRSLARKVPRLRIRGTPFQPSFFIAKKLGGLGLEPNKSFKLHTNQRVLATYMWEHPGSVISEKIGEMPTSCLKALKKFRKIRPNVTYVTQEGPFRRGMDALDFEDQYLHMCQQSTSFVINDELYDPELYKLRFNLNQLKSYCKANKNLLSTKFILNPPPTRRMVWGEF